MGIALTAFRQAAVLGAHTLRRRMLVTLEINNKDRAYEWFLTWMAAQSQTATPRSRLLTRSHELSVETLIEHRKNGSSSALFKLVAGPGLHWFKYRGAWMQVRISFPAYLCSYSYNLLDETGTRNKINATHVRHPLGDGDSDYTLS